MIINLKRSQSIVMMDDSQRIMARHDNDDGDEDGGDMKFFWGSCGGTNEVD